jgi:hypothetical protein
MIWRSVLRRILPLTLLATMVLPGCDQLTQPQKAATPTPAPKPKLNRTGAHRFVLPKLGGDDVAFDTQTGQICKTWDWQPLGKPAQIDPQTGSSPQRKYGEFAPTCLSLYQLYPANADSGAEVVLDESSSN